ncbi:MAG TPA: MaoC/PaaZ C-terminal domain-containing protein [Caulobacterales bacterium]|nr:MaoC/PaaZ C-terminal domain-containing protein [Caulobacterales bacterium]
MAQARSLAEAAVGDDLPTLETKPIARHDLALYCGGSGDHNPLHTDSDFAKQAGLPDVIAHGMLSFAYLGRMLTDWADARQLKGVHVRFVSMTQIGAPVVCSGEVTARSADTITVSIKAQQGGRDTIAGEAVFGLG